MKSYQKLFRRFAAGLITGGADNDPAGISTYSVAGATTGYSQLWLMVLAAPMLIAVQSMCARIGDITQKGLAAVIKENFPAPIVILTALILIVSNTVTIGANLVGVGAALELTTSVKLIYWIIPVTLIIWILVIFPNFKAISKYFLWLVGVFAAYIFAAILARPDWPEVLRNIVFPSIHLNTMYLAAAVGIMGTTITPFLFFWQTKEEVEEKATKEQKLFKAAHEEKMLAPGFIFSQIITLAIMISSATAFYGRGTIQTAADAARALEPVAGPLAKYLFALGIVGSGLLSIPILAVSTGYVVAETIGWKGSLSAKFGKARGFYLVITFSLFVGLAIVFLGVYPIKILFYSQILAGLLSPFLLVLLLIITNRPKIMGNFTNKRFDNIFGILALVIMTAAAAALIANYFTI